MTRSISDEVLEAAIEGEARSICKERGLTYLSHEFYPSHSKPLWIAVESEGERFEIKCSLL